MAPRKKPAARNALGALFSDRWAIRPESLRQMMQIAARENLTREAIETQLGRPLDNTHTVTVRDGIARIPVSGPLFRYANLFTDVSGATSYEQMALDFTTALNDAQIRAIVLDVDSPGGEVNGCAEMAELIYNARGKKPIVAHISGDGCSGAYWLATAADSIIAGDTAVVGCIGVVATYIDFSKADEMLGIEEIEIVSSQTPNKRPDPTESSGRAQIQRTIDDLAAVFIARVAKHRGVDVEVVQAEYGQGDVFVGATAAAAGLIDGVATYEELHAMLFESSASGSPHQITAPPSIRKSAMKTPKPEAASAAAPDPAAAPAAETPADAPADDTAETKECPACKKQIPADAKKCPECGEDLQKDEEALAERARILGIQGLARPGQDQLVSEAIASGISVDAAARRFLEAERGVGAQRLSSLKSDEQNLDKPGPIAPAVVDQTSAASVAQQILATHKRVTPNRSRA